MSLLRTPPDEGQLQAEAAHEPPGSVTGRSRDGPLSTKLKSSSSIFNYFLLIGTNTSPTRKLEVPILSVFPFRDSCEIFSKYFLDFKFERIQVVQYHFGMRENIWREHYLWRVRWIRRSGSAGQGHRYPRQLGRSTSEGTLICIIPLAIAFQSSF